MHMYHCDGGDWHPSRAHGYRTVFGMQYRIIYLGRKPYPPKLGFVHYYLLLLSPPLRRYVQ
jgi:hypothetical protein